MLDLAHYYEAVEWLPDLVSSPSSDKCRQPDIQTHNPVQTKPGSLVTVHV